MSPDDHTREAGRLLNDAADLTARDTAEPMTPALLVQMAHVHARGQIGPAIVRCRFMVAWEADDA